ncbi:hemolysin family protein [Aestuariicella sp. G3-2]|uniref:hemolysin family protein n=1 Tax=Pseudomaricurvus albidus TaxID=2842452 RepID=UPI001C0B5CA5|nr:hemolysin family protein [Aestuariicella albida]MBU3068761.1 hemolysin family protein [Aestuariicella albida]
MALLMVYIFIAIGVSFLCSVVEAVLLSLSSAQVAVLEQEGKKSGAILKQLKADVSRPLAAVLSLNTIAHTIGAAGSGAQATKIFGSASLGVVSAILTLLILVLSEIIPKTIGAHYARQLAPATAYILKYLVILLMPLVVMSEFITRRLKSDEVLDGFSRDELSAMADLGSEQGALSNEEVAILKNLLLIRDVTVREIMTPRTVLFSLSVDMTVGEFFHKHQQEPFSRIPVYEGDKDNITGYVIKSDLLLAQARGNEASVLANYRRRLPVFIDNTTVYQLFQDLAPQRSHIMLIVNEYGSVGGIVTMEDIIETLLGFEIIDEKDRVTDMQKEASRLLRKKANSKGVDVEGSSS